MSVLEALLESPAVYGLWQAPFALKKLAPVLANAPLTSASRVLDVGCGPGTNAALFDGLDYVGIDWNDRYIRYARRHHRGTFVTADLTTYVPPAGATFDLVLINSFLHHLDDASARIVLAKLGPLLSPDGAVHILELVRPSEWGAARLLAHWDRGKYARTVPEWAKLIASELAVQSTQPYPVSLLGLPLWHMVYVMARRYSRASTATNQAAPNAPNGAPHPTLEAQ